jgi:hemerythrin-like metal-binding protein
MPFMTWTEEMSVGVEALDDDHKKMIDIVNELHEGIEAGHKKEILGSVLGHLLEYTRFHFAREEEFFAQTNYPAAVAHKMEHDGMVKRVLNVHDRFNNAPVAMLDLELMSYLKNWLVTHIQNSDRKYQLCLNNRGIR